MSFPLLSVPLAKDRWVNPHVDLLKSLLPSLELSRLVLVLLLTRLVDLSKILLTSATT